MAIFQLGSIIKNRREALGFSQEDLADGICSVPTLSRIENGERMPTKNHFEMLMQRLGYSAMSLDYFTDKQDFLIHELKFKVRQAYTDKNYQEAKKLLDNLEKTVKTPTKVDDQFILLHHILLEQKQLANSEKLYKLETAIQLTCPKYKQGLIPRILSYEEIILLNNIAIAYEKEGNTEHAIAILLSLKDYYDHHVISVEEALRTQPMILYNLSKMLGVNQRYDECIEICDFGIRIARTSGRCSLLGKTLFNRAWALIMRNSPGDKESAKQTMKLAYYYSLVMGKQSEADRMISFYEEHFLESI